MIGRLLLAIDRSGHAEAAIGVTAELAADLRAEVRVLHVHETPIAASMYAPGELEAAHVETLEAADALVERAVARLRDAGVAASGRVSLAGGPTAGQIVAAARERDIDLVVIGALGASRWHELLVGGVAHTVVQLATCPVLVVPRRPVPGSLRRLVLGGGRIERRRAGRGPDGGARRVPPRVRPGDPRGRGDPGGVRPGGDRAGGRGRGGR